MAFRRSLKQYTGATPTEVVEAGGLGFVIESFVECCGRHLKHAVA